MITSHDTSNGHLRVTSRCPPDLRVVRRSLIVSAILLGILLLEFSGFNWLLTGDFRIPTDPIILVVYLAVVLVPIAGNAVYFWGSERIELRDREFTHERYVGKFRREHDTYDLLKMRGLELVDVQRGLHSDDTTQTAGVGIRFWYGRGRVYWFGNTLSADEQARLVMEMRSYDFGVRESLGMDTAQGLADVSVWTSPEAREAGLKELYSDQRYV